MKIAVSRYIWHVYSKMLHSIQCDCNENDKHLVNAFSNVNGCSVTIFKLTKANVDQTQTVAAIPIYHCCSNSNVLKNALYRCNSKLQIHRTLLLLQRDVASIIYTCCRRVIRKMVNTFSTNEIKPKNTDQRFRLCVLR